MSSTAVKIKQQLQEDEYRLPIHWILRKHGLRKYMRKTELMAEMILKTDMISEKILDIGCGDGRGTYELSRLLGNQYDIKGIDFSERAIAFAKLMAPDIKFEVQHAAEMPESPESYDIAVAREVIEHIPPDEVLDFLKEIYRVLKPNGRVLLTTPSENRRIPSKHFQHFTPEKLTNLLSQSGFRVEQCIGYGWFPPIKFEKFYRYIISLPALWRIDAYWGTRLLDPQIADGLLILAGKQ